MPGITVPKTGLAFGAGYLYWSLTGVSVPVNTVVGSVFTDTWTGWTPLGITKAGHTENVDLNSDPVEAAEYIDPILNVITSRTVTIETEMQQISLTNFKLVFNGGTKTQSGSGSTLLTSYTLPTPGTEVRVQLGWESTDNTERWWALQCFNTGSVKIDRKKGADNATLPVTFTLEPDSTGQPINHFGAGTVRG